MIEYRCVTPDRNAAIKRPRAWSFIWWPILAAGGLLLFGGLAGLGTGAYIGGYFMAGMAVALLVVAGNARRSARRQRIRPLMAYLLKALRLKLPLPEFLNAAAASESARVARRLQTLSSAIADGRPLSAALAMATPQAPERVLGLIARAEQHGDLADTLERLLDENVGDAKRGLWSDFGLFRVYVLIMVTCFAVIVPAISVFDLPRYVLVLGEHGFRLPWISRLFLIQDGTLGFPIAAIGSLIIVIIVARAIEQLLTRGIQRRLLFRPLFDQLAWRTPIIGMLQRSRGMADALTSIAAAAHAGVPLDEALNDAAMPHLNLVLQRRLRTWSDQLSQGHPIDQAAAAAGMPAIVSGMVGSAVRTGAVAPTCRALARYYRSNYVRVIELLHGLAAPAFAAVGGALVLITWLAMYGPMIVLINNLTENGKAW